MAHRAAWARTAHRHKAELLSTSTRNNYRHIRHEWVKSSVVADSALLGQHYSKLEEALEEARMAFRRRQVGYDYYGGAVYLTSPPSKRHKPD